jgi:hypothetical protein
MPHKNVEERKAYRRKRHVELKQNPEWVAKRTEYLRKQNEEKPRTPKDPEAHRVYCRKYYHDKHANPIVLAAHSERIRQYRKRNPDKVLDATLRRKFGVGIEIYTKLLEEQSGACAVCKVSFDDTVPNVDHNHTTQKMRGLLCMNCNIALGHVKDSVEVLESAIEYLKKYKEN